VIAALLCAMAFQASPDAPAAAMTDLVVEADGFADSTGQAALQIRGPDDPFRPGRFAKQVFAPIHEGKARFQVGAIQARRWALTVFHDRNRNGVLDHNVFHLPAEPVGFSGTYRIGILSGMPTFDKLAVELVPGQAKVVIHVH